MNLTLLGQHGGIHLQKGSKVRFGSWHFHFHLYASACRTSTQNWTVLDCTHSLNIDVAPVRLMPDGRSLTDDSFHLFVFLRHFLLCLLVSNSMTSF